MIYGYYTIFSRKCEYPASIKIPPCFAHGGIGFTNTTQLKEITQNESARARPPYTWKESWYFLSGSFPSLRQSAL